MMKRVLSIVLIGILLAASSLLTINFVCGSTSLFFTLFCIIAPFSGFLLGFGGALCAVVLSKILLAVLTGVFPLTFIGLPTLAASWCWALYAQELPSNRHVFARFFLNIVVPFACMILFIIHPSVGAGWLYSLYWLIPVGLYVSVLFGFIKDSLFSVALSSTFIAHALGSLLWCYMVPMTSVQWLALIPVVAVERFIFAVGMVGVYYVFKLLLQVMKNAIVVRVS